MFINYFDFNNLIRYLYTNNFVKNICINLKDIDNKKIDIELLDNLINEMDNNFYIKTKYSNSILNFKKTNKHILINIKFQKLLLRNRYETINNFVPSDVDIILSKYNIIKFDDAISNNLNKEIIDFQTFIQDNMKEQFPKDDFGVIVENSNGKEILDYLVSKGFRNCGYDGDAKNNSFYLGVKSSP